MTIKTKRIYDAAEATDGARVLVDRVWPRGVRKGDARIHRWHRGIAPSPELRRWFNHDPARFDAFAHAYRKELEHKPEAVDKLVSLAREGDVTLVYAARDRQHNHAEVLASYLREKVAARSRQ